MATADALARKLTPATPTKLPSLTSVIRKTTTPLSAPIVNTPAPKPSATPVTADTAARRAAAVASPTPTPSPAPTVTPANFDLGVSSSSPAGSSVGDVVAAAPKPVFTDSMVDSDSQFALQKAALTAAMQKALSDIATARQRYNVDYDASLKKLGFSGNSGVLDTAKYDANTNKWFDASGKEIANPASWNETDITTASGRGYENALNDFAARGMLQSTAYGRAHNNLDRALNEQVYNTAQARMNALADWTKAETEAQATQKSAEEQARVEAANRIKASLGLA